MSASGLQQLSRVLGEPARWRLLKELDKGEARTSKYLAILREAGLAMTKYGRIYQLIPAIMPDPDATHLDFGYCLLKLE